MFSLKTLVYLVFIGVVYAKEEELTEEQKKALDDVIECGKKWDMTEEDFKNLQKFAKEMNEKVLCFIKCSAEKDGTIDENGNVKKENINKIITFLKLKKTDEEAKNITKCLESIPQVKKCADILNVTKCISPDA